MRLPFVWRQTYDTLVVSLEAEVQDKRQTEEKLGRAICKLKKEIQSLKQYNKSLEQDLLLARTMQGRNQAALETGSVVLAYLSDADAPESGTPKDYIEWLRFKLACYER